MIGARDARQNSTTSRRLPTNLGFFSLEYQAVVWVLWHLVSVHYVDQLPTIILFFVKNLLKLSVEIGIRRMLDAVNLGFRLSHLKLR